MSGLVTSSIKGHTPLPPNTYIDKSSIHGHGIFAAIDIPKGFDFGITHVADDRFPDGYIRTPFGGFINHCFEPNCKLCEDQDTYRIKAVKDISKGQELTVDYRPWYSDDEILSYQ